MNGLNNKIVDTKAIYDDNTLQLILSDCEERLDILENRKQTSITLGRINEIQLIICYLQQKILNNIK